jgi:GT2 family glycosyltransferase
VDRCDELIELRQQVEALEADLADYRQRLRDRDHELRRILESRRWRLLSLYGRFKHGVLVPMLGPRWLARYGRFKHKVLLPLLGLRGATASITVAAEPYDTWAARNEALRYDAERAARRVAALPRTPTISVVTPVYSPPVDVLEAAISSVVGQFYPHWQLCMWDDASPDPDTYPTLKRHASADARVRIGRGERNGGIAAALNSALGLADGEYVAFLDHDDLLTPDALLEMAEAIVASDADLLYSDEDKIDAAGRRHDPFFKPDWSPDYLLSINYTCHLSVMRRELVERLGRFGTGLDGSQDYDMWLRASEATDRIVHVPKILYHWRQVAGSTAADIGNKTYAHERSRRAIAAALERRGIDGHVDDGPIPTSFRVVRRLARKPLVSVIIPTRDRLDLLSRAVRGIERGTDYDNVEILIVDNGSTDAATLEYLARVPHRVIREPGPFNYSRLNNRAASHARGELLLLLNNDTEPLTREWLTTMVEHTQRPEVGIVGAKLLYPSGRVQHAGVVLGVGGVAGHAHKHFAGTAPGYFHAADLVRNSSAVTAACMLVKRELYESVGGFDDRHLAVAFNDVDFCLRVRELGYLVVFTPYALLRHYESESRGFELDPAEIDYMIGRWGAQLLHDPYYNDSLTLVHEDYSLECEKPEGLRVSIERRRIHTPAVDLGQGLQTVVRARDNLAGLGLEFAGEQPAIVVVEASGPHGQQACAVVRSDLAYSSGVAYGLFDTPVGEAAGPWKLRISPADGVPVRLYGAGGGDVALRLLYARELANPSRGPA